MVASDDLSALLSSSALVLVGVVLTSTATLVERMVVARAFSLDAYGEVSIALAILTIGSTVSMLGLNHGVPRYVARFDDDRDVRGVWLVAVAVAVAVAVGFAAAAFLAAGTLARLLFDAESAVRLVRVFAPAIPLVVALNVGVSAIRGLENTRFKLYAKNVVYPAVRLGALAVMVAVGVGVTAAGYAYVLAAGVAVAVTHVFANRLVPLVGPVRTHARDLVAFSLPLVLSMVLGVLLTRTDTLMLGYFRSSSEVALYGAAYPLANSMLMVVSSFGYLYLPLTSRLDADGDRDGVDDIYRVTAKWSFVLTFPAFLVFVAFPGDVLALAFTEQFRGGGPALAVLSVGFFSSAALGRNRETLSALGHTRFILGVDALALGLNVVLNLAFVPAHGAFGAAVASAASFVVRNLAINVLLHTRFDITPLSKRTLRTYATLPVVFVPAVVVAAQWLSMTTLVLPVALVALGGLTLVAVTAVGGLQPEDAVVLDLVESTLDVELPFVRRFIPSS